MIVVALHGFLGAPEDWRPVQDRMRANLEWRVPDIGRWLERRQEGSAADFARELVHEAERASQRTLLLGYSMGGRLAMQAFALKPAAFAGAIFVSANPGLRTAAERADRLRSDEEWARRFETEAWPELMRAWNAQGAFSGTTTVIGGARKEEARFSRPALAAGLRRFSLGAQPDLRAALAAATKPTLWLSGARDVKFDALMREGAAGLAAHRTLADAGHRAPWDQPDAFAAAAQTYIDSI